MAIVRNVPDEERREEYGELLPNGYRLGEPVWRFAPKSQSLEMGHVVTSGEYNVKKIWMPRDSDVYARFALGRVNRLRADEAFRTRDELCEHYRKIFE